MSLDPRTLDDRLFYVVVFGPAVGESVVLRAPGDRWIVVDTLQNASVNPALELLAAAEARWSAIVLTHPHRDHAHGLGDLLRHPGDGPVGCVVTSLVHYGIGDDAEDQAEAETHGAVSDAVNAIDTHWDDFPDREWGLEAGDARTIGRDVTLLPLWPTEQYVQPFLDDTASPPHPNHVSTPLLVAWHEVRVVLGADLPAERWSDLLACRTVLREALGAHDVLKVPHHGSTDSIHPALMAGPRSRRWLIAPYRPCRLPRMWPGEGGDDLLRSVDALRLSAPPQPLPAGAAVDGVVRARRLGRLQQQAPAEHEWPAADRTRGSWTVVGLTSDGRVADVRQGCAAVEVTV